jgi:23S rRNA (guanosine2251-2'-O)-methyltransferase
MQIRYNNNMKKIFIGTISCKSVLEAEKRPAICLYVDSKKRTRDIRYICRLAEKKAVPVEKTNREALDRLTGSKRHGGIALSAGQRMIPSVSAGMSGFLCLIDGVEDPYNLGSICRTLYAAGCSTLILPRRSWENAESTIQKASAGAYERLDIRMYEDASLLVKQLQADAVPLYCAYRKDAVELPSFQFPETFCLAIGGALRGLQADLIDASAKNLVIPYERDFRNALDTPSAAAVFAYEYIRQKKEQS